MIFGRTFEDWYDQMNAEYQDLYSEAYPDTEDIPELDVETFEDWINECSKTAAFEDDFEADLYDKVSAAVY